MTVDLRRYCAVRRATASADQRCAQSCACVHNTTNGQCNNKQRPKQQQQIDETSKAKDKYIHISICPWTMACCESTRCSQGQHNNAQQTNKYHRSLPYILRSFSLLLCVFLVPFYFCWTYNIYLYSACLYDVVLRQNKEWLEIVFSELWWIVSVPVRVFGIPVEKQYLIKIVPVHADMTTSALRDGHIDGINRHQHHHQQ